MFLDEHKYFFLEKWTHAFCGKRGKVEVLICKVLQTFSLNFSFSRSTLTFYILYFIVKINKLFIYLKWKELNKIIPGKAHRLCKRVILFAKRVLG